MDNLREFYKGKNIFITGHSGFKGTWLVKMLTLFNANVTGYSLENGDIRNLPHLKSAFDAAKPSIVFHLAAQPLVIESYKNPVHTYETNVLGTVNLLECVRLSDTVKSVVNVTTDKVYSEMGENLYAYRETDKLGGFEPYSNSKACAELVTESYVRSFITIPVSTARAGNVIGGGDRAANRIIPDCVRAASDGETIFVRNPNSTRPYQHVLEPLFAYLLIAMKQYDDPALAGSYNIGPENESCITTGELVNLFCEYWRGAVWETKEDKRFREADFLRLDNIKAKVKLGFLPKWNIRTAIQKTVEWELAKRHGDDLTYEQIHEYCNGQ